MKVEISNKDFITYLILLALAVFCIVMWMKIDNVRLESQVKINTQSILNIDAYLQQQIQQQSRIPQLKLPPPEKKEKE